jgi:hypothetical protein
MSNKIQHHCGMKIQESGFKHGFKEPQRNVWKSRKWTSKEAEGEQKRVYRWRLRNEPEKLAVFDALDYCGFSLSEIDEMLLSLTRPGALRRDTGAFTARERAFRKGVF